MPRGDVERIIAEGPKETIKVFQNGKWKTVAMSRAGYWEDKQAATDWAREEGYQVVNLKKSEKGYVLWVGEQLV